MIFRRISVVFLLLFNVKTVLASWSQQNLPNPRRADPHSGYKACGMPGPSLICDPDAILTDSHRQALNYKLMQFHNATSNPNGETVCKRKGTTVMLAILNDLSDDMLKDQKISSLAVFAHNRWSPDAECRKSFIIILPTQNWRYIARDFNYEAPIFYDEFTFYFFREHDAFMRKDYYTALTNIISGLQNAVILKRQLVDNKFVDALTHYEAIVKQTVPEHLRQTTTREQYSTPTSGFATGVRSYFTDASFLFAVVSIAIISFALLELFMHAATYAWLRCANKSNEYCPSKSEKNNAISQMASPDTTSSQQTSPNSRRSFIYVKNALNLEPAGHTESGIPLSQMNNINNNGTVKTDDSSVYTSFTKEKSSSASQQGQQSEKQLSYTTSFQESYAKITTIAETFEKPNNNKEMPKDNNNNELNSFTSTTSPNQQYTDYNNNNAISNVSNLADATIPIVVVSSAQQNQHQNEEATI